MENFGEKALARSCFATALPHYLDSIGVKSLTSPAEMASHFPELLDALDALLSATEKLRSVRGKPVFLFGESLGGYLSIALTSRHPEVVAVSEFGGGLPPGFPVDLSRLHGLLISHGTSDRLVPAAEAISLDRYCVTHHIPVKMKLYRGESHYLSSPVQLQIVLTTIAFFRSFSHQGDPTK